MAEGGGAIARALAGLLLALAGLLLAPLAVDLALAEGGAAGFVAAIAVALVGAALLRWRGRDARGLSSTQALLVCGLGWIALSVVGAIPLAWILGMPALDAVFETVSGFTTTGITLLSGLDGLPRATLLWRALTQWVGGLGILTLFLVLIREQPGLHALAGAEAHKIRSPRLEPGVRHTLRILWAIYAGLTALIALGLLAGGVGPFDAICHALTTLSTGGFSTHDASVAYYAAADVGSPRLIEYVIIAGMLAGGTSFLVHYQLLRGRVRALWALPETRWWWAIVFGGAALVAVDVIVGHGGVAAPPTGAGAALSGGGGAWWLDLEATLRAALFQVLALVTTTGFGTVDVNEPYFGGLARQLFLWLMLIGGCVGSTGGGFKVLRFVLLGRILRETLRRALLPGRAVAKVVYDGKVVDAAELEQVAGLFLAWLLLLAAGGAITALLSEHDAWASLSAMFSALNNIGPCYIPVADLPALHPAIKVTYIVGMLAGRLEIIPLALLFSRRAWR
ncbi:MAG: TrkH family potassium uptake protein [Nannocystaceae bacterium]